MKGQKVLNTEQEKALTDATRAYALFKSAEADELARAREEALAAKQAAYQRIAGRKESADRAAAVARLAGVPISRIAKEAMASTWAKAQDAVKAGLELMHDADVSVSVKKRSGAKITREGDYAVVKFSDAEFEGRGLTPESEDEYAYTFFIDQMDEKVYPRYPDSDETWMHPVVAIVMGADSFWRDQIVEALSK